MATLTRPTRRPEEIAVEFRLLFPRERLRAVGWERPALAVLLVATAALYLWGLSASGWANAYYSAAVQAATKSWKAFFFGSFDAGNFITVDKAPGFLWPMGLSARIFGVNSWSILVPQALEGVAAVGLLYAGVRRWFGAGAGLIAGAVLAFTPVATLMFRFNNPDAMLVLLLVGAAYAMVRAVEKGSTRWLVAAGSLVGFAFLAKMLQALLVVPGFALVYLLCAPTPVRRRVVQLVAAGVALLVSAGWWLAAVALWPASSRPYIGGSQNNSIWNLLFGYNGFGRLSGNEAGSVGGGGPVGSRWGVTGLTRLFGSDMGTQSSWLLPAALIVGAGAVMLTWRAGRRSRTLVALGLWGSWLLVTAAVFSFGRGIIHPYYTVALAPAIGAVVGIGGAALWRRRSQLAARCWMAATVGVTAVWSSILLARTPSWHPMLRGLVLGGGLAVAVVLVAAPHLRGRVGVAIASTAMAVCLSAPGAYSLSTAATAHTGAIPSAGPASTGPGFGPGRGFRPGGFGGGGPGGLLDTSTPSASLVAALESGSGGYAWVAATPQAEQAAGYQLATGRPVMAIGGFNGTDPAPTLAQFEQMVRAGKVHWFIAGGGFGGFGGGGGEIASWVESHFSSRTVDGVTLYDLSANQG